MNDIVDMIKFWAESMEENGATPAVMLGVTAKGHLELCTRPDKSQEDVKKLLQIAIEAIDSPENADISH